MHNTDRQALAEAFGGRILFDEPMSAHTTFRIGGPCDAFLSAQSQDDCREAVRLCRERGIPLRVCGNGSNLLVRDGGIRGLVLRIGEGLAGVSFDGEGVTAGAGILLSALCAAALRHDPALVGLEFASGIPGTLGGALMMNAGAYGGEMSQVVSSVRAMTPEGDIVDIPADRMDWGYRHSALADTGYIALSATLALRAGDREASQALTADYARRRREKQPLSMPSAGSVFKRPPGHFAGDLIERTGLKGLRVGGAQVSEMHANFIVNLGDATASDVLSLIERVREGVHAEFGVWLEPELHAVGEGKRPCDF